MSFTINKSTEMLRSENPSVVTVPEKQETSESYFYNDGNDEKKDEEKSRPVKKKTTVSGGGMRMHATQAGQSDFY